MDRCVAGVETQPGCVDVKSFSGLLLLFLSVFICVVCREMDHVNTSSLCTFFL